MQQSGLTLGEKPYSNEDAEWDQFVETHPHGSFLQTTQWARLKGRFGWRGYRVWVKDEGKLVAGAQILFRSAAFGLVKMGYMPHGPIVDWSNSELVEVLFNQLDWAIYENRAGILKFEPYVWQHANAQAGWQAAIKKYDLVTDTDTIQPPRTMTIDLAPSLDDIMKGFKSKTRYNIRLAGRKGVRVREATADELPKFNALMQQTGQRNDFGVHTPQYYTDTYNFFAEHGNATILLAEFEGNPLASILLVKNGEQAVYLAGGSSNEERNRMPTYAIQWAAIEWAKAQGCNYYDLWGLPDAEPDQLEAQFQERRDGLWGVYRFKRGFDGDIVRTVGSADKVYNKLVYRLYRKRRGLE